MSRVLILGSTGMLGNVMARTLTGKNHEVIEANRLGTAVVSGNTSVKFDALHDSVEELFSLFPKLDYCFNAIGRIRQLIDESDPDSVANALSLNRAFPHELSRASEAVGVNTIQITTDCVFSGKEGGYNELSAHSPSDLYGISKSEGERASRGLMQIRSSIVGREINSQNSLLNWFLSQDKSTTIQGYTNHIWNGVTTLQFSLVVAGVMRENLFRPGNFHLVPEGLCSKYELLKMFARGYNRQDLEILPTIAPESIDRSLGTVFPDINRELWDCAGYTKPPTIEEMVLEYAAWDLADE
jgi:dTDP-4-dehydrorhamnose reductase